MNTKHTVGEARVVAAKDDRGYYIRVTSPDYSETPIAITRNGCAEANAARIVHTWNHFDSVVEALKLAHAGLVKLASQTGHESDWLNEKQARETLSQALSTHKENQ